MTGLDLLLKVFARIAPSLGGTIPRRDQCWIWTGACSQSGSRGVFYPAVWINGRVWRVNRLVLMLYTGPKEYPQWLADGEDFLTYLERLRLLYKGLEASHTCDNSRCVNPEHLEWKGHRANVQEQVARRYAARAQAQQDASV